MSGPHQALTLRNEREKFLAALFDTLWETYRARVSYVRVYEEVVAAAGAKFQNDHIAFRTFASQTPLAGIPSLARIFAALDYRVAGAYSFEDKHLTALHLQHPNTQLPKLFISELRLWQLSPELRDGIAAAIVGHRPEVELNTLAQLRDVEQLDADARNALLATIVKQFQELPWPLVEQELVTKANEESQYAAWTLVHGYNVNHFTSLVNSHQVDALDDIEKTVAALKKAGVPMKEEIEGDPGSKLRQTATEAVTIDVDVLDHGQPTTMPWTYAYFELAQRDLLPDPASGKYSRFEGFLGPQATNLFEMTRVR
jgi:hypothetical protein